MKVRTFLKILYHHAIESFVLILDLLKILFFSIPSIFNKVKLTQIKSESCIVLGNGPSIKEDLKEILDLSLNSDVMALNFFCNSEEFQQIKPGLYCIADPVIFNSIQGEEILPNAIGDFIRNFNKIDWHCDLYYPKHFDRKYVLNKIKNPLVRKIPYNSTPLSSRHKLTHLCFKYNLGMPVPESVIIPSIFITINQRFKKIYLFGVDHSWARYLEVDGSNNCSFLLSHFWGNDNRTRSDRGMSDFFMSQHRLFSSHEQLKKYSAYRNVKIINKTKTSLIDSYDRYE